MLVLWNRMLLPQSVEQCRDMDLIGFIVAGQHMHDQVDAKPQGNFALAGSWVTVSWLVLAVT